MHNMKKTAIIIGATGLVGSHLLKLLIEDKRYETIKLFSRSKIENVPSKVKQFIGDILDLEQFQSDFTADEVFCCVGTTAKKTPDKTRYRKIDYGIPVAAVKLAKANAINAFLVISAMGANRNSAVFYNKTKGEMEHDILQQDLKHTFILRPALIGGERYQNRTFEKIGLTFFKVIQPLLTGKLKKYRIVNAETIAQAMINLANSKNHSEVIITSDHINTIGNRN
jgi:uncharacterized protein YbjT (DUF2867 family)